MRVSFALREPKKKGITAIYASLCYSNKRVIIFPGESIETNKWLNRKGVNKPKEIPENNALIGRLDRAKLLYKSIYEKLLETTTGLISPEILKKAIHDKIKPLEIATVVPENKPILITTFFDTMIQDMKTGDRLGKDNIVISAGTIKTYTTTLKHFKNFQVLQKKKYALSDISQKLIDDFAKYLNMNLELNLSSSGKYLKKFTAFMNYAKKKNLITINVGTDVAANVTREVSDSIYLTETEIDALLNIKKFPTKGYEIVLDLFIIGCKTGLRYSDFSRLRLEDINNGFIDINTQKTDSNIIVPTHSIVKKILLKYPGGLPKCPTNQVFNRYIKELGKQVPELNREFEKKFTKANKTQRKTYKRWMLITSHTARRSFVTNEILKGTPASTVMAISGHTTEKVFSTYNKATQLQKAQLLQKEWDRRGE